MAMEELEVPSRSYIIRWVDCARGNTIQWSIKPHKKSLNFGVFRHPGNGSSNSLSAPQPPPTARSQESTASTVKERRPSNPRNRSEGDAIDRIHAAGLLDVYWHGKCEAEKVTTGTYHVKDHGGMFALVFDNTFSKQLSKTATFVLLTYPSNQPPPASHALHHADSQPSLHTNANFGSKSTLVTSPTAIDSTSLYSHHEEDTSMHETAGFQTGILKKRKRKRHQGYARRFFSLDFTSSTLSYYLNRDSSALRGAIPLSLAAISAHKKDREICIDSGAEVWHLRALNDQEWDMWKTALEKAAQNAVKASTGDLSAVQAPVTKIHQSAAQSEHAALEERGWTGVEGLLGRVSGVRDAVRRLTAQAAEAPTLAGMSSSEAAASSTSVVSSDSGDRILPKKPFWKRRSSANYQAPALAPTSRPRGTKNSTTAAVVLGTTAAGTAQPLSPSPSRQQDISDNLQALLTDLDSVVEDFSHLVSENKQRRWLQHRSSVLAAPMVPSTSRMSMESNTSDEFFDAEDALDNGDRVVMLNKDEGEVSGTESAAEVFTDDESSEDEGDSFDEASRAPKTLKQTPKPATGGKRDLKPLPLDAIHRRDNVPEAKVLPPSLIGFLRKNVGKDLSTIAMPVSANEPISLLQRLSEQLEHSELLDRAVNVPAQGGERILYVAAFAVSAFSAARIKERSIRKPFNPMLGETFELVREDKGFRFLSEKISHRPVIMACHADSANWSFSQSPQPTQKFWGKSAELITSGRVRIEFPKTGDRYSYTVATSFLRNIIAGEKYVEPTGHMHIHNETTGEKAVVYFKQNKGMFAGRSEEVTVQALDSKGHAYPLSLAGKWTENLVLHGGSAAKEVWRVGSLVEGAPSHYGFTQFAAQLNEITPVEKGKLPPTDSRLRPDQRMAEMGQLDDAEEAKLRLEEAQRSRRKEMEDRGAQWAPRWFKKVREYADEEVWRIVDGKDEEYWECREKGKWEACPRVFES